MKPSPLDLTTFSFPTTIRYGVGARRTMEEFASMHQVKRPLLVTDGGLLKTDSYRLIVLEMDRIWPRGWQAFSDVHPNPIERDVEAAWASFQAGGCDAVVGLGGGSALDAAKAVRIKAAFPTKSLADAPLAELPRQLTPMCAIPTTAGTGSEVGRSTVITIERWNRKGVFGGPPLMPNQAILDPELTVGLPPHLTAATGMDAMTHAMEAYVCPVFHPLCDAIALEAIRIIRLYLPRAVRQGADLEARGQMLIAASMGAVAFQKDLGAAHSLAHPLSTEFVVHHGLANAIVLPHVVRFNGETENALYDRVAAALGLAEQSTAAEQVASFLSTFNTELGLPTRLRDVNVPRESLPMLASKAIEDGCHLTNPRPCSQADLLRLYELAW
jgi:4-hydroxybutyrate dehydrogenase